jgi:hypothetical protein
MPSSSAASSEGGKRKRTVPVKDSLESKEATPKAMVV